MRFALTLVALAASVVLATPAAAHEAIYEAPLLGTSETPKNSSPGTGFARVTIDFDLFTMRVEATFSGLVGNVTASHIHCCTAAPGVGNIGVATQLPSFTLFPAGVGVHAGSYDHTFDMSLASSYNQTQSATSPGFLQINGNDVATAFNALVAGLDAHKAYLNVHTSSFPGGEIRGLLAPVPEPETYALMLAGLALVGWAAKQRRPV
jgi:hypothetical protein